MINLVSFLWVAIRKLRLLGVVVDLSYCGGGGSMSYAWDDCMSVFDHVEAFKGER